MVVERSVATAFLFLEDIDLSLEYRVRSDGLRFSNDLTTLNFLLVNTTEEKTDIVASLALREKLTEHLDAGNNRCARLIAEAYELDRVIDVDGTGLDTTGNDSTTAGDREDVLDRHEEVLVSKTNRKRNVLVYCIHELHNLIFPLLLTVECAKSGTTDDRAVLVEFVECEKVADFHLNEIKHFLIVNKVNLVHENEDLRNVYLTGEKDVLASLRHRTVGSSDNKDSTVHLGSTGNHVLHVVGVTRAVNVCIVTLFGLVLNVSGVDGNTTLLLFRSVVDLIERLDLVSVTGYSFCEHLGDSCGESGLAVVNVADSTDVDMRFGSLECFFCHNIMFFNVLLFYTKKSR